MHWIEHLQNPQALSRLYKVVPELDRVELTRLELDRDGPTLLLTIVLPRFPDRPPGRWMRSGFNTATLRLRLFAVSSYLQSGWQTENTVRVEMSRTGESISLTAVGERMKLEIICGFIDVAGVAGYFRVE